LWYEPASIVVGLPSTAPITAEWVRLVVIDRDRAWMRTQWSKLSA